MKIDAIILGAGTSERMSINKLTFMLGKYALINHTVQKFINHPLINRLFLVTNDDNIKNNIFTPKDKQIIFVNGGSTRTQSVSNALKVADGDYLLIHDGARPFVSESLITETINCTIKNDTAIPVIPLPDSIREMEDGMLTGYPDRANFCLAQTPQGFNGKKLRHAYSSIGDKSFYDDSQVYALFYNNPHTIKGDTANKKVTFDNDLLGINAKVGIGYDIHKLQEGLPLILGGVHIPHNKGFIAHSDGDVLIHSIMDALLGMANERDIGVHFPNTDKKYKGINSILLLKKVAGILNNKHIGINNICAVIIAQEPKLNDFVNDMIKNLANALEISKSQISINITTNENIGMIGNGEAIAVYTICSGY